MLQLIVWTIAAACVAGAVAGAVGYLIGVADGIRQQQHVQHWLDQGDVKSAIKAARNESQGYPYRNVPAPPPRR